MASMSQEQPMLYISSVPSMAYVQNTKGSANQTTTPKLNIKNLRSTEISGVNENIFPFKSKFKYIGILVGSNKRVIHPIILLPLEEEENKSCQTNENHKSKSDLPSILLSYPQPCWM